jgi:hypothetical protein
MSNRGRYGWQVTAVVVWLLLVVIGATLVRGWNRNRVRKQYLSLNDEERRSPGSKQGGSVWEGNGMQRAPNGRVGKTALQQAIASQEDKLTGGAAHAGQTGKTSILKAEAAVGK